MRDVQVIIPKDEYEKLLAAHQSLSERKIYCVYGNGWSSLFYAADESQVIAELCERIIRLEHPIKRVKAWWQFWDLRY